MTNKKLTERQKAHMKYINSTEWAKVRADILLDVGFKCERCDSKENLQVHHITYERFGGGETRDDLIVLCSYHHMLEHGLVKKKRKRKKRYKKRKKGRKGNCGKSKNKSNDLFYYSKEATYEIFGADIKLENVGNWSELARFIHWCVEGRSFIYPIFLFKKKSIAKNYVIKKLLSIKSLK